MFKKSISLLVFALVALPFTLILGGCDEETRPDPELQKQRDAQRAGMQGGGQPTPGQPAPGTGTPNGAPTPDASGRGGQPTPGGSR
ncbi:MAG: hypothetical protein KF812_05070 [Fimbriimonadaceae bacterium]|nr:hypothetical protein [Fimbriimonadaceae bacterium]